MSIILPRNEYEAGKSITVKFGWVRDDEGHEPALIFVRRNRRTPCAFIIALSSAYKYTDDHYLMRQCFKAAKVLQLEPVTQGELKMIADAIIKGLDDLVRIPPREIKEPKPDVIGEGVGRIGDHTEIKFDVTDDFLRH